jgi:hypothetical protein
MNDIAKRKTRLIKGELLNDGVTPPGELLVVGITHGLQCWKDRELLDELSEEDDPLPDAKELNNQIPQAEWGLGLDGKPRAPWQFNWVVYLFDPDLGETYTYLNSTTGASIAVERLDDRLKMTQRLRGKVLPIVKLDSRPMKIAALNITKLRPEFSVTEWRDFNGEPAQLPPPPDQDPAGAAAKLSQQPAADQSPPWKDLPSDPLEKKKTAAIGRPVKPVTSEEELNDSLEDFLR